jgi:alkylhydroperoxidase/carboxymuconolactone decarboxylase family protein YurZ
MCKEELPTDEEITKKILAATQKEYGFIPVVNQVLSQRPDLFVPAANLGKTVLEGKGQKLERKTAYLCAISAASAIGGEYCTTVQMKHAVAAGATKDEILEAIVIGSYMAMTRSQSYALRRYQEMFGPDAGKDGKA